MKINGKRLTAPSDPYDLGRFFKGRRSPRVSKSEKHWSQSIVVPTNHVRHEHDPHNPQDEEE